MARLLRLAVLLVVLVVELCWGGALSARVGSQDTEEHVPDVHLRDLKFLDIFPNSKDEQALIMAATDGDFEKVEMLLDKGVDPDVTTARDSTPLMLAAFRGHLEIVEALIDAGADVNSTDIDELTSLHWASQRNHTMVVRVLLESGADLNKQGSKMSTPLFFAAQSDATSTLAFLLQRDGIEVELMNFQGWTPLIVASDMGHEGSVGLLLEAGANTTARSQAMATALHRAVLTLNGTRVINLLVENGAEIDAQDNMGDTPLEYASWAGNTPAVQALMVAGANASIPDNGRPPQLAVDALCGCIPSQRCATPCDQITNDTIKALLNGENVTIRPPTAFVPSPVPADQEPQVTPEDKPVSPDVPGGAGMLSPRQWLVACFAFVVALVSLLAMC
ncbi:unnamed protein product [Ostreobium quekettii]|uniref:Uncharacterized protein n=1 Tax=Ostreobium quekettii TaxID=121088 RepID=A0A8S1ISE7_9CHLO|nr:unnamed protein product [Ostreobium quekettii]